MVREEADGPLRADARRNRDLVIAAAAAAFGTTGVDAPMQAIAERAGVGVGTIYRHFPKRSDLIGAVFRREVDECADAAAVLLTGHPPQEALSHWLDRYQSLIVTKRGLASALHSGEPAYESLPHYFEKRLVPSLQRLLDATGNARDADISAADLLRAVSLRCTPAGSGDAAQTRRMVSLLLKGLSASTFAARAPDRP